MFPHNISIIIAYLDKNDNLCYNGSIVVILLGKNHECEKEFCDIVIG